MAVYPPQPVYRVEQGPIHNVVVVPYEVPHVRFDYLPPRFFADCGINFRDCFVDAIGSAFTVAGLECVANMV